MIKTFFVYFPYVLFVIAMLAFVLRCRLGVRAQAIWAMVLLVGFSKFLVFRVIGGDAFTPELPQSLIWGWDWAYSGAVILSALGVLTVAFPLPRRVWVLPLVAWSLAAWGVWNGIRSPIVSEVRVECEGLPRQLDGYRIVQLSDIHVSAAARRWRTERIVELANACNADLMVITGDLVDGNPAQRLGDVRPLGDLRARDGVYAVTGNHERYFNFWEWRQWYDSWGIRFLSDECAFPRPGLALGGVSDRTLAARKDCQPFAAATNGEFRVLLVHRPKFAARLGALHRPALMLSGHTHGGVMPLMRKVVARFNDGRDRGLYGDVGAPGSTLYISPGAGQWAGFPVRFLNPCEITVFTLTAGSMRMGEAKF